MGDGSIMAPPRAEGPNGPRGGRAGPPEPGGMNRTLVTEGTTT